jgi:aryl-alcohol dehydrogenase-like predicted oxidoreductase
MVHTAAGVPLVLGGHSFISQLGSDPAASPEAQTRIVQACLDAGIRWFDTTYQPERVALGRALEELGRRDEATVIAWNFFTDFGPAGDVGGPAAYQPHHIALMLEQLRTDRIDCLVVHGVSDPAENARQQALAVSWREAGLVGRLGVWHPGERAAEEYGRKSPYSFMVRPYNVTTPDAAPAFAACKALGWETLACSPFVRGWELEKAASRDKSADREQVADLVLRYSLFAPNVDRLIVAMRRPEWVARNVASWRRGPLTPLEQERRRNVNHNDTTSTT